MDGRQFGGVNLQTGSVLQCLRSGGFVVKYLPIAWKKKNLLAHGLSSRKNSRLSGDTASNVGTSGVPPEAEAA